MATQKIDIDWARVQTNLAAALERARVKRFDVATVDTSGLQPKIFDCLKDMKTVYDLKQSGALDRHYPHFKLMLGARVRTIEGADLENAWDDIEQLYCPGEYEEACRRFDNIVATVN